MMSRADASNKESTLTVLLVEDNPLNQHLTAAMLTEWRHRVDIANNGMEALELYRPGKYDLILLDLQMPEMDGFETAKKLREREALDDGHVTIVAMTANSLAGNREKCLAAGMDDFFIKPFTVENFKNFLSKYTMILLQDTNEHNTVPFNYASALQQADQRIVAMISTPFLDDLPEQILTMRRSWEKHDLEVFRREALALSQLLGTFNARPAQSIATEIDLSLRSSRIEKVMPLFRRLEDEIELFSKHLRSHSVG